MMERRRWRKKETGGPQPMPEELRRRKEEEIANIQQNKDKEEEWKTQGRKHSVKKKEVGRRGERQWIATTSFYISNLPDGVQVSTLYKVYGGFGDLVSVYVANKRDKDNNNFGFLRFANVKDSSSMEEIMKGMTIEGAVIGINVALYDRWNMGGISGVRVNQGSNRNSKETKAGGQNQVAQGGETQGRWRGSSFKDILVNKTNGSGLSNDGSRTVLINPKESLPEKLWAHRSLAGELRRFEDMSCLYTILEAMDVKAVAVKYLGSLMVMLLFDT